jgi:hypothetical protein
MKLKKDDWFKNKTWTGNIDSNFEDGLKRTRASNSKAEFLQIQGCILLNNNQRKIQEVGIALLNRLFEDFQAEHPFIILAQEKLGDYFLKLKDYTKAAYYFKLVNDDCMQRKSRSGTSEMVDLKLADALLKNDNPVNLKEAYQLITEYPLSLFKLNENRKYHALLLAEVSEEMNKIKG